MKANKTMTLKEIKALILKTIQVCDEEPIINATLQELAIYGLQRFTTNPEILNLISFDKLVEQSGLSYPKLNIGDRVKFINKVQYASIILCTNENNIGEYGIIVMQDDYSVHIKFDKVDANGNVQYLRVHPFNVEKI